MTDIMVMQGRELSGAAIGLIRDLLVDHPHWGRTRLSEELCRRWGWCNAQGRPKDMAARSLLLKLERGGHLRLPPRQRPSSNGLRNRHVPVVKSATDPIRGVLRDLRPLTVSVVAPGSPDLRLFNGLLAHGHYLGHRNTVGENLRYLVRDCQGRPVACALANMNNVRQSSLIIRRNLARYECRSGSWKQGRDWRSKGLNVEIRRRSSCGCWRSLNLRHCGRKLEDNETAAPCWHNPVRASD